MGWSTNNQSIFEPLDSMNYSYFRLSKSSFLQDSMKNTNMSVRMGGLKTVE